MPSECCDLRISPEGLDFSKHILGGDSGVGEGSRWNPCKDRMFFIIVAGFAQTAAAS